MFSPRDTRCLIRLNLRQVSRNCGSRWGNAQNVGVIRKKAQSVGSHCLDTVDQYVKIGVGLDEKPAALLPPTDVAMKLDYQFEHE